MAETKRGRDKGRRREEARRVRTKEGERKGKEEKTKKRR